MFTVTKVGGHILGIYRVFTSQIFGVVGPSGENVNFLVPRDLIYEDILIKNPKVKLYLQLQNDMSTRKIRYKIEKQQRFQNLVHGFLKGFLIVRFG